MYYPRQHRLTTCLLLAAYLAANTFSGLFHDHSGEGHSGEGHACEGHLDGSAGCRHAAADHDSCHDEHDSDDVACLSDDAADGNPLHDDECAVCRFVGQRVMAVQTGGLDCLCDLIVELTAVHAVQPSVTIARTMHSRAPPLPG
jgi:hypothetical protein